MLGAMRRGAQNIFVKGFLLLLAASFVLWGVGDVFRGRSGNVVASVGDYTISNTQFSNELRDEAQRYQQILGKSLTEEQIEQLRLRENVLNRIIKSRLFMMRADDLKIRVGEEAIKKALAENESFQDEEGDFDKEHFKAILQSQGLTEERFVGMLKRDASINLLLETIASPPETFDIQSKAIYNYRNEERVADLLVVSDDSIKEGDIKDPMETELLQFYQENPNLFSVPEYREVSYFTFGYNNIKEELKISDDELREQYQLDIDSYRVPETRDVDQYIFEDEERAKVAKEKLVAKQELKNAEKIAMGAVAQADLLEEVRDTIFSLEEGSISNPIQTPLGWHVFVLNDIIAPRTKPFAEVKEVVKEAMVEEKAGQEFENYISQVEDDFAAGLSIEEITKKYAFITHKINAIDANGRGANDKEIADLPDEATFVPLVFDLEEKVESPLTLLPDNLTYLVARVDSISPQRVKALDEVKGKVISFWKKKRRIEKAYEKAQAALKQLKEGKEFRKLAGKMKLKLKPEQKIKRAASESPAAGKNGEPAALAEELFNLEEGQVTNVYRTTGNDGFVIAELKSVAKPEADNDNAMQDIEDDLKYSFSEDIIDQYNTYLRKKFNVTVNEKAIKTGAF